MATLPVIRYELDPSGTNPNNRVAGEIRTLPARQIRAIAPTYGAFYTASLQIRDTTTNALLVAGTDYYPAELYELPTAKYGKEVCGIIVISNPAVSANVSIDYQAVGGPFSYSADAVVQQINALNLDDRPVAWGSILSKPSDYPPSHHLHDIGDIYGFEYLVHALERVRSAIAFGDAASHDQIYQYIDHIRAVLEAEFGSFGTNLTLHLNDHNNPHQVTATQLGVYIKSQVDALVNAVQAAVSAHVGRTDNPHSTTAAQLGVYLSGQVDTLINNVQSAINTVSTNLTNLQNAFNAHANGNNPHGQYVLWNQGQGLPAWAQAQARANIGADTSGNVGEGGVFVPNNGIGRVFHSLGRIPQITVWSGAGAAVLSDINGSYFDVKMNFSSGGMAYFAYK